MSWHEFVFSEKKSQRYIRHIVFWMAWWLYFFGSRYFFPQTISTPRAAPQQSTPVKQGAEFFFSVNNADVIQLLLILFIQIIACYVFIYYLLPRFLLKARYLLFTSGIILLSIAMVLVSHFIYATVTLFIKTVILNAPQSTIKKATYWASIAGGAISGIKIIAVAMAIKLGKYWWLKQKEKERLEKEKIEAELQLLKAQIHPQFLFNTLNNIYSFALMASPKAPEMLLKLSDMLSYMLYECNDREVPLEKEIKMIQDYISLEKMRYGDRLEMNIQIKGNATGDKIAPLLLLRFIENSFRQSSSNTLEQAWINMELQIENHILEMKLMNGKPAEIPEQEADEETDLSQAERRLLLLYPGRHALRIREEPEIMIISLQLQLKTVEAKTQAFQEKEIIPETLQTTGVASKLPLQ